ncbi:hypothetical protein L1987_35962 [Smallanthus sonchifolius]|uniref:Uncharacterized protein n=1 Tax=Smallanthus sonchifolius TaxID=185202 RepID=A0ACB9HDJ1_9ASTR|nr:hypothetical protein L1987_35962 [Smallanthus sonchifolius]
MTIPMTTTLQTDPFCNCEGCIDKVKKTLRKFDIESLSVDPETGEFTFFTTKHPEVIKYALKGTFPKRNITVSQETNHPNPMPPPPPQTNIMPSAPPIPTTPDIVYGYPAEFYGYNNNHPHGCRCSII